MKPASKLPVVLFLVGVFVISSHEELHAQYKPGTIEVGVGGLPVIYFDQSNIGYAYRANVGLFVLSNLSVGIMTNYGRVNPMTGLGANLYARYYIGDGVEGLRRVQPGLWKSELF